MLRYDLRMKSTSQTHLRDALSITLLLETLHVVASVLRREDPDPSSER